MINSHRILGALSGSKHLLAATALIGAGLLVSGCGQKGPLYISADMPAQAKPAKPATDIEAKEPLSK